MNTHGIDGIDENLEAHDEATISRFDTGLRVLLTLLFAVIWGLTETVLGAIVVFGLIWSLVTRQAPPPRLRDVANRLVTYAYHIWRYLTQNDPEVPFPFSDFPEAIEPSSDLGADEALELREMLGGAVEEVEEGLGSVRESRRGNADE